MNKFIFSIIFFMLSICAIAQEKVYVHTTDGKVNAFDVSAVDYIDFEAEAIDNTIDVAKRLSELELENSAKKATIVKLKNMAFKAVVPEDVDLGLSVRWASFNLGATKPEEKGWYLGWGELNPQIDADYDWDTYLSDMGAPMKSEDVATDNDPLKEYVLGGSKFGEGIKGTVYDAVYMKLGGNWRMPTQEDFKELYENCTKEWVDEDNKEFNGVTGYKFTSKVDGYTDKYIFLPATAFRGGGGPLDITEKYLGNYWLADADPIRAYCGYKIYFYWNSVADVAFGDRYMGFTIRPVKDLRKQVEIFRNTYARVLSLTEETARGYNRGAIEIALEAYSALETSVQEVLKEEKMLLETLSSSLDSRTEDIEYVQLWEGGLKWSNMNLGATSETDNGLYFWWGDVVGHAKGESPAFDFAFGSEEIPSVGNNEGFVVDGKLPAERDAATILLGEAYRMPTKADFHALDDNCVMVWKENYKETGVNGYIVVGKGDYSDRSIFLPAAGFFMNTLLHGVGECVCSWTSNPYADYAYGAAYLAMYIDHINHECYGNRSDGMSIRPVME